MAAPENANAEEELTAVMTNSEEELTAVLTNAEEELTAVMADAIMETVRNPLETSRAKGERTYIAAMRDQDGYITSLSNTKPTRPSEMDDAAFFTVLLRCWASYDVSTHAVIALISDTSAGGVVVGIHPIPWV